MLFFSLVTLFPARTVSHSLELLEKRRKVVKRKEMRQTCKCFARRQNFSACLCTSPHRCQFYAAPTRNRNCSSTTHKKKRLSADRSEAEPEEEQRISRRDEDSEKEALDVMDTLGISRKTKSCSGGGSATVTVPTTEASGAGDLHAPRQNSPTSQPIRLLRSAGSDSPPQPGSLKMQRMTSRVVFGSVPPHTPSFKYSNGAGQR